MSRVEGLINIGMAAFSACGLYVLGHDPMAAERFLAALYGFWAISIVLESRRRATRG